jgi:hypothetical protein
MKEVEEEYKRMGNLRMWKFEEAIRYLELVGSDSDT